MSVSPERDCDELSVTSEFSIIPDSIEITEETQNAPASINMTTSVSSTRSLNASLNSIHNNVEFRDINGTYSGNLDIPVSYTLKQTFISKSSDRIALYPVGFSSPQDYFTFQWAPTPTTDHIENALPITVIFKGSTLPREAGEFFQFCYLTHEGRIVGISKPWQLMSKGIVSAAEVMNFSDDESMIGEDLVMVSTSTSRLQEKLVHVNHEKEQLECQHMDDDNVISELRRDLQEKQKLIEDQMQKISQDQHHMQVLETKMKRETSEKCELMGRLGSVVEEKGHLEDRLRVAIQNLNKLSHVEDTMRKAELDHITIEKKLTETELQLSNLEMKLSVCQRDLALSQNRVTELDCGLRQANKERDDAVRELEVWTSTAASDKTEKDSLAVRFIGLEEDLTETQQQLADKIKELEMIQQRFLVTVETLTLKETEMKDLNEKMEQSEEVVLVSEERRQVIANDNERLKENIAQLRDKIEQLENELENIEKEKEAAERIAVDLSGRLQNAKAEYQSLVKINMKLVKKIRKLRDGGQLTLSESSELQEPDTAVMAASVMSQGSTWMHLDHEEIVVTESTEESEAVDVNVAAGSVCTAASCSSCCVSTRQLSEEVNQKMKDIIDQLSLQISLLQSRQESISIGTATVEQAETHMDDSQEIPEEVNDGPEHQTEEEDQPPQVVVVPETQDFPLTAASDECEPSVDMYPPRLYANCLLPTQQTAPVFFPAPEPLPRTQHTLPPASQHMPYPGHYYPFMPQGDPRDFLPHTFPMLPPFPLQRHMAQAVQSCNNAAAMIQDLLPPPMMPDQTTSARLAALSRQLASMHRNRDTLGANTGNESEEEDFHSTGGGEAEGRQQSQDADIHHQDVVPQTSQVRLEMIECPICNLSFQPGAMRLLEEHINSHLEYICPICSTAFQRNSQHSFEDHVQAHFTDDGIINDTEQNDQDSSGPWSVISRHRILEID